MQSKSITFSVAGSWQRSSVLEEIRRSCRKCDKRRRFGSLLNVCSFLYLFICFSVVLDPCGMQEEIFYYTGCEITLSRLVNQLQKKKKCVKSFFLKLGGGVLSSFGNVCMLRLCVHRFLSHHP